jgi:hypothetical protein
MTEELQLQRLCRMQIDCQPSTSRQANFKGGKFQQNKVNTKNMFSALNFNVHPDKGLMVHEYYALLPVRLLCTKTIPFILLKYLLLYIISAAWQKNYFELTCSKICHITFTDCRKLNSRSFDSLQ